MTTDSRPAIERAAFRWGTVAVLAKLPDGRWRGKTSWSAKRLDGRNEVIALAKMAGMELVDDGS